MHKAEAKALVIAYSNLHQNILDVFNEYGVQIMSPHYMMDPASEKIVKPEDWHRAPAKK